jgi:hypothetical protein
MKRIIALLLISFSLSATNISGIVNQYYTLTNLSSCDQRLTFLENHTLSVNDTILIIQMQGASINTANNATFGTITAINSAGAYELNVVDSILSSTEVRIRFKMTNVYNLSHKVQVVSVPFFSSATVTSPITALPWNGSKGGIIALYTDTLILNSNIVADTAGFRGFDPQLSNGTCLSSANYLYTLAQNLSGKKGESIHLPTSNAYECGKGKQANGGGGANEHNAGGGGGSNVGQGGTGGQRFKSSAFNCPGFNPGLGGESLLSYLSNHWYMGGAGGNGHMNNSNSLAGCRGGGIILIKSNKIIGHNKNISANGQTKPIYMDGDGGAGGGGGGTIIIMSPTNNIDSVNISAKGGDGQSITNDGVAQCIGAGGGGGGGAIYCNHNSFPSSIIRNVIGGAAGISTFTPNNCAAYTAYAGVSGTEVYLSTSPVAFHWIKSTSLHIKPIITISKDTTICNGNSVALMVTNLTNAIWSPSTFLNITTGTNVISTPTSNITYTISGDDSCGNKRTLSVKVDVQNITNAIPLRDSLICAGSPVSLSINIGSNVIWTPNIYLNKDTGNTIIASPTSSQIYYVSFKNACGIPKWDTVNISVKSYVQSITADTTICNGESKSLQVVGILNPVWLPNKYLNQNNTASIISTPDSTIIYTVSGQDNCGKAVSKSVKIIVDKVRLKTINDTSLCIGFGTTMSVNTGQNITWTPTLYLNKDTGKIVMATPTSSTTYIVSGKNLCNQTMRDTVTISIKNAVISKSNDSTICQGGSLSLWVTNMTNTTWSPSGSLNTTSGNNVIASPTSTTIYTASGMDSCNNARIQNIQVTVDDNKLFASNDTTICQGMSTTMSIQKGQNIKWTPSTDLNTDTGQLVIATPTINMTYFISAKNKCSANLYDTIHILVKNFNYLKTLDSLLCKPSPVNLKITNGKNTTWSPNLHLNKDTGNSVITSPSSNITYRVQTQDDCGFRTYTDSIKLTVYEGMKIIVSNAYDTICNNTPLYFTGLNRDSFIWNSNIKGKQYMFKSSALGYQNIKVIGYKESCIDTQNFNVFVKFCSNSITEIENTISLYPNPAKDIIHLDFRAFPAQTFITLFDAQMRQIMNQKINQTLNSISIKNLSTGTYFIEINIDGYKNVQRIEVE